MRRTSSISCVLALVLVASCSDPDSQHQTLDAGPGVADAADAADAAAPDDDRDGDSDAGRSDAEDIGAPQPLDATDDYFSVLEGATIAAAVLENDGGQGELTVEILQAPAHGSATVSDDGTLSYQAPSRFNGFASIDYRVSDSRGRSDQATAYLGVYATLEPAGQSVPAMVDFPRASIESDELAVVINTADPVSVSVGEYYAAERNLPAQNIIRVELPKDEDVLSRDAFEPVRQQIEAATPDNAQAYALAWIRPYRVDCMSMTSVVALGGFDAQYCNTGSGPCSATSAVDYYGSSSTHPFDDHNIRPTMMLGGVDEAYAKALVDRGLAAEASFPSGRAHLVRTSDEARSVRWPDFEAIATNWAQNGEFEVVYTDDAETIENDAEVLFYFTGLTGVAGLDTNTYVPGAVADHLTSYGGRLTSTGGQMSILRWLEAGATGSYGTVVEPCNYTQKFPHVSVFLSHYFGGETLVEAYWKSVQWPGEGVFVGDPLARPWGRHFLRWQGETLTIETTVLEPNTSYEVVGGDAPDALDQVVVADVQVADHRRAEISVEAPAYRFLRLQRTP